MKIYYENENLSKGIEEALQDGYKYIVKGNDKFLGGWGKAEGKKHIQLILARNEIERNLILQDLKNDKNFNYINWDRLDNKKAINNYIRGKSYTLRNDWTRAFHNIKEYKEI